MNESHQREAAIFDGACELPPADRPAYLDHACAGDSALRHRISALLKAYESSSEYLDAPADAALTLPAILPMAFEKPGDRIGRYKLLQQIGEGGCGVVYMAEQEEPVTRRVALKIIKLGMDTKSVIARFEAERQALALMDHPNIAKVLDAGATETGRPYFVMELVRGMKITDYCDEKRLPTRDRLHLFIQVCQAIQHAHQKGIIHRDIKPSNILVTVNDGVPVPKVIDFGIAKATSGQKLTDKTVFTAFEQFIGTPAYMSPEQAVLTSLDIDTRSDIYALGVLLYELLTGKTPFDPKELLAIGLDEMRRTICEQEPSRPSTRISTLSGEELSTTAQRRGLDAPKLVSELRGDLDLIVMKALEKDRNRRYESASAFAEDVRRHLGSEPIQARPASAVYAWKKMMRRHRVAFAAATAVATALLIGLGASTCMYLRERETRKRAEAAEQQQIILRKEAETAQQLAQEKEKEAKLEASRQKQLAEYSFQMFEDVHRVFVRTQDRALIQELIDRAVDRIRNGFKSQPEAAALFYSQMGQHFSFARNSAQAEAMWKEAFRLFELNPVANPQQAGQVAYSLGSLLEGQQRLSEAENAFKQGKAWLAGKPVEATSMIYRRLASVQKALGKNAEAEENLKAEVELQKEVLKGKDAIFWSAFDSAAMALADHQEKTGQTAAAEATYVDAMRFRPDSVICRRKWAAFLGRTGRFPEGYAELKTAFSKALPDFKKAFPFAALSAGTFAEEFVELAWSGRAGANVSLANEAARKGEQLAHEALDLERKIIASHPHVDYASNLLARAIISVVATSPGTSLEKKQEELTRAGKLLLAGSLSFAGEDWFADPGPTDMEKAVETISRFHAFRNEVTPHAELADLAHQWRERAGAVKTAADLWRKAALPSFYGQAQAETIYRDIASLARKSSEQLPGFLVWALHEHALALIRQRQWEEAESLLLEAVEIVNRNQWPETTVTKGVERYLRELFNRPDRTAPNPEWDQRVQQLLADLRARRGPPVKPDLKNTCLNNMRQIDGAKEQWALENKKSGKDQPTVREMWGLNGYIKFEPKCPDGGSYVIGSVDDAPRCTIHGSP